ncbi:aldehyde dehydrogenase (NAD+) [Nocardioides alpinus]|uniref:Aldehyde dehydrogenase n=1 Tax=Nocardioides alpinus TaxID=748909 RepID=A0A1I0ZIW5_9ACTN|nr:aldehyde dehydrogenase family protein [Nocardioides alpinus]PKH40607.1 aldehyde dehydrogenase [Nocardioides alpinus]SFB24470.1 aldehyde dehydrogenase (NAD+) [Nocardioides alpinus]
MSKHAGSQQGLPVDGVERATTEGWTFPARNPADGQLLWQVPDAGIADVHAAVHAAWRAFHETQWSTDTALRAEVVLRFQEALVARSDELALLLAAETGVPIALRAAHVDAPIAGLRADRQQEPPGVTAVITPATSPLAVAIEEIGRVLVAGGTVVLKPAPEAASAALELGRIGLDILPRGVLNVVSTRDVDVAIALTLDDRVDEVSLTGSAVTAERVQVAGERAGKRVRLDVGGPRTIHAPDDGDLAAVVAAAAVSVAANAGQGCRLPSSVVVPAHRHAEAVDAAVATMAEVVVGDPAGPDTLCGPLRSTVARARVLRYLDLARAEGGTMEVGGRALDRDGWWVPPTVISGLDRQSRLVREEVLGPVLMVVADRRSASWGHA